MRLLALLFALCCSSAQAASSYVSFGELRWQASEGFAWTDFYDSHADKGEAWGDYEWSSGPEVRTFGIADFNLANTEVMGFTLAPGASVTFSVLAGVRTSDIAQGTARIGIWEDYASLACLTSLGENCDQSSTLTLSATNGGRDSADYVFSVFSEWRARQDAPTSPAPEPETWALMAIGLTALAVVRRRSASRA